MNRSRAINTTLIVLSPILVAALNWSVWGTALWLVVLLLWRWATVIGAMRPGPDELILDSIAASHFVEKARWCLDWLGLEYSERRSGGALGAIFLGRTVPRLRFRTGVVTSSIGNSAEILRYLWGRFGAELGERAGFLRPTPEALELEHRLDRYGANLQVWIYHHILPNRELTLHAWGANDPELALWQRWALRLCFPLDRAFIRRAFRITPKNFARSVEHIHATLADVEQRLEQHQYLMAGHQPTFVDITFAALSSLWLAPEQFAAGRSSATRPPEHLLPAALKSEVADWTARYPRAVGLIQDLYEQRTTPPA